MQLSAALDVNVVGALLVGVVERAASSFDVEGAGACAFRTCWVFRRTYALDERDLGHNERLLAQVIKSGLLLAFARRHGIDLRIGTLVGTSTTDATMARALGMSFRRA